MHLSLAELLVIKAVGILAAVNGANFAVKRIQYENDPVRSKDPMIVKGLTWALSASLIFVAYKALTLKSKS